MSEDQKFAEFLAGHFYLQELDTDKSTEGEYSDDEVQQAWEVWQSAREELATITADRDIKAANLQLLVENVLDYAATREAAIGGDDHVDTREAERLLSELTELARSLKQ